MKKMPLMLLALALVALPLSSCGDDVVSDTGTSEASESVKPVSSSAPAKEKFTIAFEADGKTVTTVTVEEGDSTESPVAPEKEGYRFLGWAFDEAGNRLADFPYSPSESTTLYAVYLSNLDYFLAAREKTLGGEGWRYKDELAIRTKLGAGSLSVDGPTGIRDGEVAHDEAGEGTHYAHYVTSGALFFDGESTSYRDGTSLLKVEQDEDGNITGATSAVAVPGVEDDGSTFAKAIFEYEEEDIHAILETEEEGVYEIDTKMNASSIIKSILGNLNNAVVEAIVGALPETVPDFAMYVTFTEDGYVDTYLYDFEVQVSVAGQPQTISLSYALDFTSYGKQAIAEPSFPGLYIERDEIAGFVAEEKEAMGKYLSSSGTSYDYELKTDVDFSALSLADSITVKGSTKREIKGGEVYFSNIVETDYVPTTFCPLTAKASGQGTISFGRESLSNGTATWSVPASARAASSGGMAARVWRKAVTKPDDVDLNQMTLFDTVKSDDIVREIEELQINEITPVEALNILSRMQSRLKNRWQEG